MDFLVKMVSFTRRLAKALVRRPMIKAFILRAFPRLAAGSGAGVGLDIEMAKRFAAFGDQFPERPGHAEIFLRDAQGLFEPVADDRTHLISALDWLLASQREGGGGGYAVGYSFQNGWYPPYPETTGYIVWTMWDAWKRTNDERYRTSAIAGSDWEIEIQMENGAVMAGYHGKDPNGFWKEELKPASFNTGQVIQGWNKSFEETGDERYLAASRRATDFLVDALDDEGIFTKGLSPGPTNLRRSYYTRVAHAMAWTGVLDKNDRYIAAARRHLDWATSRLTDEGWFQDAEFHKSEPPLTHTLAYTAEGLLYAGRLLEEPRYVEASRRHVERVMHTCERRGMFLPGRLDASFKSDDHFSCVTGNAQFAALWLRHGLADDDLPMINTGLKMVDWLKSIQPRANENEGIRGAMAGSWPIDGGYSVYIYLNWATKFFADALLLAESAREKLANE